MPSAVSSPSTSSSRASASAAATTSSSTAASSATARGEAVVERDRFEASTSRKQRRAAERALARAGLNPGEVDGRLKPATRRALRRFQRAKGLEQSGELDRRSYQSLMKLSQRLRKKGGRSVDSVGMQSRRIRAAEKNLQRLGYDVGKVDGLYTRKTAAATQAFKHDQPELENHSGLLGPGARRSLAREGRRLEHQPYHSRVKDTAAQRRDDARAAAASRQLHVDGSRGIGQGSRGPAVKTVQAHLRAAGYDPKRSGGRFDERTEGMVKAFQRREGLEPTGRVDWQTWKRLRGAEMEARGPTSPPQRVGERSAAVRRTEQLLRRLGYKTGPADGLYTAQTQRAVDRFRRDHGMRGRGRGVTAHTLEKIRKAERDQVSVGELTRIMPGLGRGRAAELLPHLNRAMREFDIKGKRRQAAFLAQLGHESGGLRYFEELASGAAYEGRTDLGNVKPGDGKRYKGRGPIQLTGRANYRAAGRALGLPLVRKPKMAARPSVGFRIAGWYWKSHGLNQLADRGHFDSISRIINGGDNGLHERRAYWARAKRALG